MEERDVEQLVQSIMVERARTMLKGESYDAGGAVNFMSKSVVQKRSDNPGGQGYGSEKPLGVSTTPPLD